MALRFPKYRCGPLHRGRLTTITYADGMTATFIASVAQNTAGDLYRVPHTSQNAERDVLEAKPVLSVTFDALRISFGDMVADWLDGDYVLPDGR